MAHDVAQVGPIWSLLVGDGPCRRSYEVTFSEAGLPRMESGGLSRTESGGLSRTESKEALIVHVNGTPVTVERRVAPGRRRSQGEDVSADTRSGPVTVVAPMPGRVVKVLVAVGDTVEARQGLLVLEAMKMENELRAPRAGTVREIRAAQGSVVEAGTVVVVIES